jgi:ribonuclease HII
MSDPARALARFDERVRASETTLLVGVDEVGRGCLAGPVVAAAVVLPRKAHCPGLDDSKRLTAEEREAQAQAVRGMALAIGFAFIGPRRIDANNIRRASLEAMRVAILRARTLLAARQPVSADSLQVLIDGLDLVPGLALAQQALVQGDARSLAIAAASVVAKTVRDGFMVRLGRDFPRYGFERNKGYGTQEHLEALDEHGPCCWHRYSYAPVAQGVLFRA